MERKRKNYYNLLILFLFVFGVFFYFPKITSVKAVNKKIPIVYFSTPGCEECEITRNYLDSLKEIYPYIEIKEFSLSSVKNRELLAHFDKAYNVPPDKRNTAPAVFIGKKYFVREEVTRKLENAIKNYDYSETSFLESVLNSAKPGTGKNNLVEAFQKFGVLTVLGAGLIDGYNPCAFTVLIFFISFLLLRKKSRREILVVGSSFIVGFGVSYFLLGIGLFNVISKWKYFDEISKWVYLATAIITFVFALFTISDYFKAKQGRAKDMTLQLSGVEKKTIHSLLRNPRVQGTAIFSFIISFPVSIVSFSCTGQTYLPTIVYIYSIPSLKARATLYLLLYNIMFVLPLIIIVYVVYRGASSQKITDWFKQNLATVKLWTGVVFFALCGYLTFKTMLLFNVIRK